MNHHTTRLSFAVVNVAALLVAVLITAVAIASCGGSGGSAPSANPAASAPSSTLDPAPETSTSALVVTGDEAQSPSTADTSEFTLASGDTRSIVAIENGTVPPLPNGATESFIEFGSELLHVIEIEGDGPPILLMHGFPDNIHLYDELFAELDGRRVVAFDFIGWGESSKPLPSEYPYSAAQQVQELEAVIDALELSDLTLVVHDASGPPAIDYAIDNPDRVSRIVMLNTYYSVMAGLVPPKAIELHATPALDPVERAIGGDREAVEALFRFQMSEFIVSAPNEEDAIDRLWAQFPEAYPAFIALNDVLFAEVGGRNGAERLAQLTMPVDVVFGAVDPYLTAELAESFHDALPNSTLTLIDGASHFVQIDAPAEVAAVILGQP